jgi:hypothetical protein
MSKKLAVSLLGTLGLISIGTIAILPIAVEAKNSIERPAGSKSDLTTNLTLAGGFKGHHGPRPRHGHNHGCNHNCGNPPTPVTPPPAPTHPTPPTHPNPPVPVTIHIPSMPVHSYQPPTPTNHGGNPTPPSHPTSCKK